MDATLPDEDGTAAQPDPPREAGPTRGKLPRVLREGGKPKRVRRSFGPYKFDKTIAREFIKSIKIGCPVQMASACAGVAPSVIYDWIRKGAKKDGPKELQKFRRNYRLARHFAGKQDITTLFKASVQGNIEAAKWRLARRYPKTFGATTKVELTGAAGGPVKVQKVGRDPRQMTTVERRARLAALLAKRAAADAARAAPAASAAAQVAESSTPAEDSQE